MQASEGVEIEVKFRIGDATAFAERLRAAGAKLVKTGFEKNIKYDRNGELHRKKELLRLREYAGEADITHKRKAASDVPGFKVREETVVSIESFERGRILLERLGYEKKWIYEKKRATWDLGHTGVTVDELPLIGCYVEIEGTPEEIRGVAGKLGLDMKHALTTDYGHEYEDFRKKNGLPFEDLTFPEGKR